MLTVGIDVGSGALRVAAKVKQQPPVHSHPRPWRFLPLLVESDSDGAPAVRILFLKRLLDFDFEVPLEGERQNSLAYLAGEIHGALKSISLDLSAIPAVGVAAVPPCFSQRQRASFQAALEYAGFHETYVVDDTLAALLASRDSVAGRRSVLVLSWDASAFSLALYREKGSYFEIVAQSGDRDLGSGNLQAAVAVEFLNEVCRRFGHLLADAGVCFLEKLAGESQKATRQLIAGETASVSCEDLFPGRYARWVRGAMRLAPEAITAQLAGMIDAAMGHLQGVLHSAAPLRAEAVLLVGSTAQAAAVKKALSERLALKFFEAKREATAEGAALCTRFLQRRAAGKQHAVGETHKAKPNTTAGTPKRWAELFAPLFDKAQDHEARGELVEAIDTLEHLCGELSTFSSTLYRRLASRYSSQEQADKALEVLCRAHARNRLDGPIAVDLAKVCVQQAAGHYAVKKYEKALSVVDMGNSALRSVAPSRGGAHKELFGQLAHLKGAVLHALGRFAEAEQAMRRAIALDPEHETYRKDYATISNDLKKRRRKRGRKRSVAGVGRNDPCPCGSGRKYKKCCGA